MRSVLPHIALTAMTCALAGRALAGTDATADAVSGQILALENSPVGSTASVGLHAVRLSDGKTVATHNGSRLLTPASVMKTVSTATALLRLGEQFVFETNLAISGEIDETGVLHGDVVLRGSGDPTLGEDGEITVLGKWHAALAAAGVTRVTGRIVGDESLFTTGLVAAQTPWADIGNYYGAGASALSFAKNEYRLAFRTGDPGSPTELLTTMPAPPGVEFVNEIRSGPSGSGDEGYVYAAPYRKLAYLRGTLPPGRDSYTIKGALPDPALYAATRLDSYLEKQGVAIDGEPTTSRLLAAADVPLPEAATTIHTVTSVPLAKMLVDINRWSRNLHADCLMKLLGVADGRRGSFRTGSMAIKNFWKERGVDLDFARIHDGSGLSRSDLVSPEQLTALLASVYATDSYPVFRNSLPVAGQSGTMRNFGGGTAISGRFTAKSGTMNGVKCVAGYLATDSGDTLAVALMVNHYTGSHSAIVAAMSSILAPLVADEPALTAGTDPPAEESATPAHQITETP